LQGGQNLERITVAVEVLGRTNPNLLVDEFEMLLVDVKNPETVRIADKYLLSQSKEYGNNMKAKHITLSFTAL
jgi:hypothetical protein